MEKKTSRLLRPPGCSLWPPPLLSTCWAEGRATEQCQCPARGHLGLLRVLVGAAEGAAQLVSSDSPPRCLLQKAPLSALGALWGPLSHGCWQGPGGGLWASASTTE